MFYKKQIKKGSSETIRTVCIKQILNLHTLAKNRYIDTKDPSLFQHWLASLIDADGRLFDSIEKGLYKL